ncbi:hypothetical protein LY76DRAFT_542058, partial [Colletotrichum caudatum]
MKGTNTSVLVLSGLAALARAREVKVDEVPVECATICGPIVELTYKCDIDGSFDELKRRSLDAPAANPPYPPEKRQQAGRHDAGGGHHHGAERDCTCNNKSFDVQLLAGLCQSCIRKSGNWATNLDIIMVQCNFTGADYTPAKDRLVDSIRVKAQKP